jgi:hypothetical protein
MMAREARVHLAVGLGLAGVHIKLAQQDLGFGIGLEAQFFSLFYSFRSKPMVFFDFSKLNSVSPSFHVSISFISWSSSYFSFHSFLFFIF